MGISVAKKIEVVDLMVAGKGWQAASEEAGVTVSRSTAYRWVQSWRDEGRVGLRDKRQGQATKIKPAVKGWLQERCEQAPQTASRHLREELREKFGLEISRGHVNLVRRELGIVRPKKK